MKKLFVLAVAAIMAVGASAQIEKGFKQGAQVKLGLSELKCDGGKMTFGYGVGYVAQYNFSGAAFLQSGVDFQNNAIKLDGLDGTLNVWAAEIPIHFGWRFYNAEKSSAFVQAGPTLAIGIAASDIEWVGGSKTNYFDEAKRFDLGIGGRLGYQYNNLVFSVGANYGLLKPIDGDVSNHNLQINLGVGYMF